MIGSLRRWAASILALLSMSHAAPGIASQSSIFGEWWTPGFNARVWLEPCSDKLCGTIVWTWDEAPKDIAESRPLVGLPIIVDMRPDGAASWNAGRIYNPEDGRHYAGSVTLKSEHNLLIEGCVLFICKSQVWRRFDGQRCPAAAK
jgi:uncharacterized protein (DUF2147 family)